MVVEEKGLGWWKDSMPMKEISIDTWPTVMKHSQDPEYLINENFLIFRFRKICSIILKENHILKLSPNDFLQFIDFCTCRIHSKGITQMFSGMREFNEFLLLSKFFNKTI